MIMFSLNLCIILILFLWFNLLIFFFCMYDCENVLVNGMFAEAVNHESYVRDTLWSQCLSGILWLRRTTNLWIKFWCQCWFLEDFWFEQFELRPKIQRKQRRVCVFNLLGWLYFDSYGKYIAFWWEGFLNTALSDFKLLSSKVPK